MKGKKRGVRADWNGVIVSRLYCVPSIVSPLIFHFTFFGREMVDVEGISSDTSRWKCKDRQMRDDWGGVLCDLRTGLINLLSSIHFFHLQPSYLCSLIYSSGVEMWCRLQFAIVSPVISPSAHLKPSRVLNGSHKLHRSGTILFVHALMYISIFCLSDAFPFFLLLSWCCNSVNWRFLSTKPELVIVGGTVERWTKKVLFVSVEFGQSVFSIIKWLFL